MRYYMSYYGMFVGPLADTDMGREVRKYESNRKYGDIK